MRTHLPPPTIPSLPGYTRLTHQPPKGPRRGYQQNRLVGVVVMYLGPRLNGHNLLGRSEGSLGPVSPPVPHADHPPRGNFHEVPRRHLQLLHINEIGKEYCGRSGPARIRIEARRARSLRSLRASRWLPLASLAGTRLRPPENGCGKSGPARIRIAVTATRRPKDTKLPHRPAIPTGRRDPKTVPKRRKVGDDSALRRTLRGGTSIPARSRARHRRRSRRRWPRFGLTDLASGRRRGSRSTPPTASSTR